MAKGRDTKPHIGIFGRRNNGKSSLINLLAGHEVAIVSEIAGTTTDPVRKSIELPGIGAAILIDTAGIDDDGTIGSKRVKSTLAVLRTVDLAVLVLSQNKFDDYERKLISDFQLHGVPFMLVHNKSDLHPLKPELKQWLQAQYKMDVQEICSLNPDDANLLVAGFRSKIPETIFTKENLLGHIIQKGNLVFLITPIDSEAPEGRLILPQVQAIRDVLDNHCVAVVAREDEAEYLLKILQPEPALVITDSQIFAKAGAIVPKHIPLTSFSVMLAKQKGDFDNYLKGTPKIASLKDSDRVLILESCTHHVTCDDIGRNKIPHWMTKFTGKDLEFDVVAGLGDLPRPIEEYALVVQCGGCVITRRQIMGRLKAAVDAGVPVTNYGMAIAWMHGI
ncbi:MAG TPA: [FeFe] hydrogenase H-cluster maturation GTPase HydF, partial [Bacteroidales bacterium]|nr:[FeFe] hydrogenase H-cluster maturation GTPase HydF [Bacteroidales bacterium]